MPEQQIKFDNEELSLLSVQGQIHGDLKGQLKNNNLLVGSQKLRGVEKPIKPLAVLEIANGEVKCVGIVRKQTLFSSRPEPITTKPAANSVEAAKPESN